MTAAVRRLLTGHALASVGMSLPWPLLLLEVWERTGDPTLLGLAGAARMLPYVLLSWAVGRLADRAARDRIVRATLLGRVLLLTATAGLLASGHVLLAVLAASLAVAVATPAYPALAAAMPGAAAGPAAERATGLLVTIEVASFVVGPALGGLLLAPALQPAVTPLAIAMVLSALPLLAGVHLPAPVAVLGAEAAGVVTTLRRSPALLGAVAAVALVNAVLAAVSLALLPLAELAWDAGGTAYGLAGGVLGFGALAGPVLRGIGRDDRTRVRVGMLGMAGCLLLVAAGPGLAAAVLPLAAVGAIAVQVESAATGLIQRHAPDRIRAAVLGVTDTAMVGAALLGTFVAPLLAAALGPRPLVALAAALAAVTPLVLGRTRPAIPAPRSEVAAQPVRTTQPPSVGYVA